MLVHEQIMIYCLILVPFGIIGYLSLLKASALQDFRLFLLLMSKTPPLFFHTETYFSKFFFKLVRNCLYVSKKRKWKGEVLGRCSGQIRYFDKNENAGIHLRASHMLSERSTFWATSPLIINYGILIILTLFYHYWQNSNA